MIRRLSTVLTLSIMLGGCAGSAPASRPDSESALRAKLEQADLALREARLTDAEILYRELTVSHPRLPEVWLQLGNIYARQSQLEAAMRSYKDGLRYSSADGRLWHNLALVELKQAIRTLETASQLIPLDDPNRTRIQLLHRSLLSGGKAAADENGSESPP